MNSKVDFNDDEIIDAPQRITPTVLTWRHSLYKDGEIITEDVEWTSNEYQNLTDAVDSFSERVVNFWNSHAFPEITDEDPDMSAKILTVVRKLAVDNQYEDSFFVRRLRKKLQIISEYDPYKKKNAQICSKKWEYSAVEVLLYSNWIQHNQHGVVLDMDEVEFIIDYSEWTISWNGKNIDETYL